MKTLTIYIIGCLSGIIVYFLFSPPSFVKTMSEWSIIISFIYTFIGRLIPSIRQSLIEMVPEIIPSPKIIVYVTGIIELIIALSMLLHFEQKLMSVIGIILCFILFPANIRAYQQNIKLGSNPPTNIYLRLFVQLLFILSFTFVLLIS